MKLNKFNISTMLGMLVLSFLFVACGGGEKSDESTDATAEENATEEAATEDDDWRRSRVT